MIKKSVFEDEIIYGMQKKLANPNEDLYSVIDAIDHINSAISILEDEGMYTSANNLIFILEKIAQNHTAKDPHIPTGSDQMVKNLLDHGTVFNADDDSSSQDILDADVEIIDEFSLKEEESFEDE